MYPIDEEDEICPRCGGDHAWCQSVRDDEYGVIDIEQVINAL